MVVGVLLSSVVFVLAGQIDSPAGPTAVGGQMYTLGQIYDRLTSQGNAIKMTTFQEPTSGPGSTMHTLDDIYALAWPARAPRTGDTYTDGGVTGEDGELLKGVAWPNPRFTDNSDGTVTDNLTGLIWLKNANCYSARSWANALSDANALANGTCSLSDGSSAGDWRLPNVRELQSLVHYGVYSPVVPNTAGTAKWSEGDPFTGVQSSLYWSSTTIAGYSVYAGYVSLRDGDVYYVNKDYYYVWPVRGGQ
jgi:hypothetical protein